MVAVFSAEGFEVESKNLSDRLSVPLVSAKEDRPKYYLTYEKSSSEIPNLMLVKMGKPALKLKLDFSEVIEKLRKQKAFSKTQLLSRSIGYKGEPLKTLDLTAGLGRDSVYFVGLGCHVTAIEQSAIVYELLLNAYLRAGSDVSNLNLVKGNSLEILQSLPESEFPDVIYLDPMYPQRTKSALPKKEMIILHEIVGEDESGADLLRVSLKKCRQRVVVKRPVKGKELLKGVSHSFEGKAVRYDMYLSQLKQ